MKKYWALVRQKFAPLRPSPKNLMEEQTYCHGIIWPPEKDNNPTNSTALSHSD